MAGCTSGAANPKAEGAAQRVPSTLSRWASPANRPCMPLPHGEYPVGCQQPRGVLEAKTGLTVRIVQTQARRGACRRRKMRGRGKSVERRVARGTCRKEGAKGSEETEGDGARAQGKYQGRRNRGQGLKEKRRSGERRREARREGAAKSATTTTRAKEGERRRKAIVRSPQREQPLLASRQVT